MGYNSKNLAGGLLSGIGAGMIAQDTDKKNQAIEDRNTLIAILREERAARAEGRAVKADARADRADARADRKDKRLEAKADKEESGMSAGLKRQFDVDQKKYATVLEQNTTEGGFTEGKTIRWNDVADALDDLLKVPGNEGLSGYADLARKRANNEPPSEEMMMEAKEFADKWVSEQAGWWSTKEDFADYGGNKEQARQFKIDEYLATHGAGGASRSASNYGSADEVGQAYQNGKISKAQAQRILRDQFGYQ